MIEKNFDPKRIDSKLVEVIDRVNSFSSVKQMIMLAPNVVCLTVAKDSPGIIQLPKCHLSKMMYWITSKNVKDKTELCITISDHSNNSTSSRGITLNKSVGEIILDTKIQNQVLVECRTDDYTSISICLLLYISDPDLLIADTMTFKRLSEFGEGL